MYAKEMTNTMSGSMHVVDATFPHGDTCQYIQLSTAGAGWELGILQLQMAFQYQCVIRLFFFGEWAEGNSAGDVGGSV